MICNDPYIAGLFRIIRVGLNKHLSILKIFVLFIRLVRDVIIYFELYINTFLITFNSFPRPVNN